MRRLTIAFLLTCFLPLSPALAQNWGPDDGAKPPAIETVDVPTDESLATAASDVMGRKGLTRRQKKDLGLMPLAMFQTIREIHADGELKGRNHDIVAADILSRSVAAHPKAFMEANVGVDEEFWSQVIEWIEKLLPFLLMIFSFTS